MQNEGRLKHSTLLLLILLAAVLVRLPVAIFMGDQVTVLPGIHDQVSYDALAHSLLDGRGYSFEENTYPFTKANVPTAHWSFLYPLYLAGMYALTGDHPLAARLVQALAGGALMCFLIYRIGRLVVNEETGLVAAAISAFYGYFVYYSAALMTETFFIALILLSLYLSLELKEKPRLALWGWLGLSLGLSTLLRQSVLLFYSIPICLVDLESEKFRSPVVALHHPRRRDHSHDFTLDPAQLSGIRPISALEFQRWLCPVCFQQS